MLLTAEDSAAHGLQSSSVERVQEEMLSCMLNERRILYPQVPSVQTNQVPYSPASLSSPLFYPEIMWVHLIQAFSQGFLIQDTCSQQFLSSRAAGKIQIKNTCKYNSPPILSLILMAGGEDPRSHNTSSTAAIPLGGEGRVTGNFSKGSPGKLTDDQEHTPP